MSDVLYGCEMEDEDGSKDGRKEGDDWEDSKEEKKKKGEDEISEG